VLFADPYHGFEMIVADDLSELIGHSPLLRVKPARPDWELFLKLECFNPSESFKDRTAKGLISAAEERGVCKPGTTIVESSSGNTAKALAMLAAAGTDHLSHEETQVWGEVGPAQICRPGKKAGGARPAYPAGRRP